VRLRSAALLFALGAAAGCAPCGGAQRAPVPETAAGSAGPAPESGIAPVWTDPQSAMLMPMRIFDPSGQADRFSVSVRWPAATHPDGVANYEVLAGGELLATTGPSGRGLVIDVDAAPADVEVVAIGTDGGRSDALRIVAPAGIDAPPPPVPMPAPPAPGVGPEIPDPYRARPAEPTPGLPTPIATPPPPVMPPPPGVTSAPPGSLPAPNAPGAAPATGAPPLGPTPDAGGADARDN
jgi:hypothetical protein